MLTEERVVGRVWSYSRHDRNTYVTSRARFEVLEVRDDRKLGIFISSKTTDNSTKQPDLSALDELTLEGLDELVQKGLVKEVKHDVAGGSGNESEPGFAITTSLIVGIFGFFVLVAGLRHHPQQPWEAAVGAAMLIGAVLAFAIVRE